MKDYLSIGKVSKLRNVSIKSLRYYDEIGILKPAYINEQTNYRYYTNNQLYVLDAITFCLELGIPLRDFSKYVEKDTLNFQKLLYDGKELAEQKIKGIHSCFEKLQTALAHFESEPIHNAIPESFYSHPVKQRNVLTMKLEAKLDKAAYSPAILHLFILAQLLGLEASYPSGLLYEYKNNKILERYIFIQVKPLADCIDKRLRVIPGGNYICHQVKEHSIEDALQIFQEIPALKNSFFIIESDIIENSHKKDGNSLELQLFQSKC